VSQSANWSRRGPSPTEDPKPSNPCLQPRQQGPWPRVRQPAARDWTLASAPTTFARRSNEGVTALPLPRAQRLTEPLDRPSSTDPAESIS